MEITLPYHESVKLLRFLTQRRVFSAITLNQSSMATKRQADGHGEGRNQLIGSDKEP
jgi:hypothetical protein